MSDTPTLAEQVAVPLGWVQYPDGWQYAKDGRRWRTECPPYPTDYSLVPELEEWCHARGQLYMQSGRGIPEKVGAMYCARFYPDSRLPALVVRGTGATYPEALCRAIIAAGGAV